MTLTPLYTMEASIGVSKATKAALRAAKPRSLSWDVFLAALRSSVDQKKYRKTLERLLDETEAESLDAAVERVLAMRSGKIAGLTHAEAKARLRRRRLATALDAASAILHTDPTGPEATRAVASLDKQIHETLN